MHVRTALVVTLCILVSACSPDASFVDGPSAHAQSGQTIERAGDQVNIHFQPPGLQPGERLLVETGGVQMESIAARDYHQVQLTAPDRAVESVVGLLDGQEQVGVEVGQGGPVTDGGHTKAIPTSIHRTVVCRGRHCSETIEYDYDLHDPSGNGTTMWTAPDGQTATIDRLQFVMEAAGAMETVVVTSPVALQIAQ